MSYLSLVIFVDGLIRCLMKGFVLDQDSGKDPVQGLLSPLLLLLDVDDEIVNAEIDKISKEVC